MVKSEADNKNEVTVDVPVEQQDINDMYWAELQVLTMKPPKEKKTVNAEQKQEDYYKVSPASMRHGSEADSLGRTSGQMCVSQLRS